MLDVRVRRTSTSLFHFSSLNLKWYPVRGLKEGWSMLFTGLVA